MNNYINKVIIAQLINTLMPLLYMYFLLKEGIHTFASIELLMTLSSFSMLFIDFSLSLTISTLHQKKYLSARKINYLFSNILIVRLVIFFGVSLLLVLAISFVDLQKIDNKSYLFLYVLSSVFDISWLYILKERFHLYVIQSVVLKNLIVLFFMFIVREEISTYYIMIYAIVHVIFNCLFVFYNKIKFNISYVKINQLKRIVYKSYKIALTDIVISSYSYLDVYSSMFFLPKEQAAYYILARKIVKAITGIVGQIPRLLLRASFYESRLKSYYFYILIFLLFSVFHTGLFIFSNYMPKNYTFQFAITIYILSFVIILGPLQNMYLQLYVSKVKNGTIYFQSYAIGSLVFFLLLAIFSYLNIINVYFFSINRVLIDAFIILIANVQLRRFYEK